MLGAAPDAPKDTVSYPLSPSSFRVGQVFFALTQLLVAWGMVGLAKARVGGASQAGRRGAWLAVTGFVLTVPGELGLAVVARAANDSAGPTSASTFYGMAVLIGDIGLIVLGLAALRARIWPRAGGWLVLGLGLFQLVVVTPVVLAAGFASVAAFVVISLQDGIIVLLRLRPIRSGGGSTPTA